MAKRVELAGLNCYYGDFHAVDNVSLTIEPKSVTAFIGPSGCGKSTVLRSINRMREGLGSGDALPQNRGAEAFDIGEVVSRNHHSNATPMWPQRQDDAPKDHMTEVGVAQERL